jgi:hypothetical protein
VSSLAVFSINRLQKAAQTIIEIKTIEILKYNSSHRRRFGKKGLVGKNERTLIILINE